jgi:hypothetical protein
MNVELKDYVEKVAVGLRDGCQQARSRGVNITPHLHVDIRGGKCPDLPYGNSHCLLLPVELEISLTSLGQVAVELGFWSWLKTAFRASRKASHRATVKFWIEVEPQNN